VKYRLIVNAISIFAQESQHELDNQLIFRSYRLYYRWRVRSKIMGSCEVAMLRGS